MPHDSSRVIPMQSVDRPTGAAASGDPPVFERIAVVGLGLVGGSLALAARRAWPTALVIGIDRKPVLEQAMVRHVMDVASDDLMLASEADLVVLAAPVSVNVALLATLPDFIAGDAVVTDVGSTKRAVQAAAQGLPARLPFVGGHPLAGAARAGIEFARPDLFNGRPWLLVSDGAATDVVDRLSRFVEGIGARPRVMPTADAHDRLAAFLSHLPQLAASSLMSVVGEAIGVDGLSLGGRGLVDTTRLASSPSDVWRDICATNADEIGPAIDRLIQTLQQLRDGLGDAAAVESVFRAASTWRERLTESMEE